MCNIKNFSRDAWWIFWLNEPFSHNYWLKQTWTSQHIGLFPQWTTLTPLKWLTGSVSVDPGRFCLFINYSVPNRAPWNQSFFPIHMLSEHLHLSVFMFAERWTEGILSKMSLNVEWGRMRKKETRKGWWKQRRPPLLGPKTLKCKLSLPLKKKKNNKNTISSWILLSDSVPPS